MLETVLNAAGEESAPGGIDIFIPPIYDIVWSLVPFLLILFFFWKFGIPAFRKILDERAEAIEGGIARAEEAQSEASAQLQKYTALLADARAEAGQIREHARLDGVVILTELREQATAEAARISANATAQIEAERQSAIVSLRAEVGTLALDLASSVIGQSLADDKKATKLVDSFLSDLEASNKPAASTSKARLSPSQTSKASK